MVGQLAESSLLVPAPLGELAVLFDRHPSEVARQLAMRFPESIRRLFLRRLHLKVPPVDGEAELVMIEGEQALAGLLFDGPQVRLERMIEAGPPCAWEGLLAAGEKIEDLGLQHAGARNGDPTA